MNILIMGVGGLGGVFSAELIRAGITPTLITHNPAITAAINANGITMHTPHANNIHVPAAAYTTLSDLPDAAIRFDAVWLLMKTQGVVDAVHESLPYLADDGYMVCFQNGLVEETLIAILGDPRRLITASVAFGANLEAPGVYRRTSDGQIFVGELDGVISERVQTLRDQLQHIIPTTISDNILGLLWSKLCWNAAVSGMGAILGQTYGELVATPTGRDLVLIGYREVMDTARAHGITLAEKVVGYVTALYISDLHDAALRQEKHALLLEIAETFGAVRHSTLSSLERGRPTETAYLNGYVIRKAREKHIAVPLNTAIAALIAEIEAGERTISADNLAVLTRAAGLDRG